VGRGRESTDRWFPLKPLLARRRAVFKRVRRKKKELLNIPCNSSWGKEAGLALSLSGKGTKLTRRQGGVILRGGKEWCSAKREGESQTKFREELGG